MSHFTKDFIDFFKELEKNNTKAWFDANRKRYEKSVKKPFYAFADEMISRINAIEPEVQLEAKNAVTRINRDIRFSNDKTPYNVHLGAIISPSGRKNMTYPGIFVRLSAEGVRLYGGLHRPDKEQLQKVREAIAYDMNGFEKIISEPVFAKKIGTLLGEKNKRPPKEFQEIETKQPFIANKDFYYQVDLPAKLILDDKLPDVIMEYWHIARPFKDFLIKAISYQEA